MSVRDVHAVQDRFAIRPQAKFLAPLRPLIMFVSLLLVITGLLAASDPTLIDFSPFHYLSFLGPRGLALVYIVAGTSAFIGALRGDWALVVPQQLILFLLSAGVIHLALIEQVSFNGVVVPVHWQRAVTNGLSVLLLTAFHLAALAMMGLNRQEAFTIAHSQVQMLAKALSVAETSRMTLKSAREINDAICQDMIVARDLHRLGKTEQGRQHYERALAHAQTLVTDLIREAGSETLKPGDAVLEADNAQVA